METDSASGAEATEQSDAPAAADPSSFWKSVPGIVTACTGLVVAISGLVSGLGQAGIIGSKKADAHAVASHAPGPVATRSAPEPEDDRDPALRTYYVNSATDGFGWVRKGPTKDSAGVATLVSGTEVHCREKAVPDPDPATGRNWHYCPDNGGYISAKLLKAARLAR